jgi:hypothetical protein
MGDGCWCRHLVAMRGVAERRDGAARDRLRMAERGIVLDAIFSMVYVVSIVSRAVLSQWRSS